nr:MAG TPA: LYSK, ENDOLYSIN, PEPTIDOGLYCAN, PROTEASE [Caudoviricetes sp.]
MAYTPRTTSPEAGNPFWTKTTYGGYNTQILGSPSGWSGSVLANCTGYVHGRWMELGNTSVEYDLSSGNANTYYGYADGYERGQEPRLGAILCLGGGGYGHVAIVEEIFDNGDIMVSESNYGRAVFEYVRRYAADGYKRAGGSVGGFQGFIYHPTIITEPTYTLTVVDGTPASATGKEGDRIDITANIPKGYRFKKWIINGSGSIDTIGKASTTYQFGAGDCTITATFIKPMNIMFYMSPPFYRRN